MRRLHLIAGVLLALVVTPYSSAQRQSLLPDHFGAWSRGYCPAKLAATVLATETGLVDNAACQFTSNGQSVSVWAGSFRDPSSGYEIYTTEISPGMQPSTLGQNSAIDGDKLLMLVGRVVV